MSERDGLRERLAAWMCARDDVGCHPAMTLYWQMEADAVLAEIERTHVIVRVDDVCDLLDWAGVEMAPVQSEVLARVRVAVFGATPSSRSASDS